MYGGPGLLKAGHDLNVPGPAAYSKHQHVGGDKPAFSFGPGDLIIKQKDGRVVNKSKTLQRYDSCAIWPMVCKGGCFTF